ncbi:hypothetical protein [Aliamphritea spongicola]|nr:hypothetical protein [Aliamphritea spongicola]
MISALPPAALKKALDSGADEVLAKPFDNQRLRELAQQLVMNSNRKEA